MPTITNAAHAAMLTKWADTTSQTALAFDRWASADAPADDHGEPGSLTARQCYLIQRTQAALGAAQMMLYALAISFQDPPDLPPAFKTAQLARLQGMLAELQEQQR